MPAPNLRAIFDEDPEGYDRTRPGYPEELFDDLAELTDRRGIRRTANHILRTPGPGAAAANRTVALPRRPDHEEFDGSITKRYHYELQVARRRLSTGRRS